jgi:protein gp37
MGTSTIEWTDMTWNPVTGCDRVSAGCDHCYALTLAKRLKAMEARRIELGQLDSEQAKYQADGDPRTSGPGFGLTTHPDVLTDPLRWSGERKVFVNSMSDLFHDQVPDSFIAAVFAVMAMTPQHTYQLLTKRHARMRSLLGSATFRHQVAEQGRAHLIGCQQDWLAVGAMLGGQPLPNVWLGVSAEDQATANLRIPALLETPAAVRFISAEPLLGPIDVTALQRRPGGPHIDALAGNVLDHDGTIYAAAPGCLDWVIVGGESGAGARPMHPDWARSLRDQTTQAGRAFLFKQWGDWQPTGLGIGLFRPPEQLIGPPLDDMGHRQIVRRVGKHRAGRQLDGRTWDEFPAVS